MEPKLVAAAVTAVLLVVALPPPVAHAVVYKVGDAAGWTTIGNVDYKHWAATKTFHVGDVIGTRFFFFFFFLALSLRGV